MKIQYNKINGELGKRLDEYFGLKDCLIEIEPGRILLPPKYRDLGEDILNMDVRPDDVWLVSYPRTGSTWVQEMIWCIGNDLNFEGAKVIGQIRNPLLEFTAIVGNDPREWKDQFGNSVEVVKQMKSPRYIKTHLPWELLPYQIQSGTVKPKIIYIARNPKDVAVSYYHYCKLMHGFRGTCDDFCELLLEGKVPLGSIWDHIPPFWSRRNESNILFLKYEEMKKDSGKAIEDSARFLGKTITDADVTALLDHLSFTNMKKNPVTNMDGFVEKIYEGISEKPDKDNQFIRKGQVGDWKNFLNEKMSETFDEKSREYFEKIGLFF